MNFHIYTCLLRLLYAGEVNSRRVDELYIASNRHKSYYLQ
jgi:hypothetical protein